MPGALDYGCGNCSVELDPSKTPERREVPRKGGRRLPVCDKCAREIDSQLTLIEKARSIAILPLGEIYPADRCLWCGITDRREKLREIVVKSAMARAVECVNHRRCMRRRRSLSQAA